VASEEEKAQKQVRNVVLLTIACVFALIGIIWLCIWFFYSRIHVFTDDAYTNGNKLQLSSQVDSGVEALFADEPDLVEQGQLVVQMNDKVYILNLEMAKENLGAVTRTVAQYFYEVDVARAELSLQEAILEQAKLNLAHREGLVCTGAISVEEFEQYQTDVLVAQARVEAAQKQLDLAKVKVEGVTVATHPLVLEAATSVRDAYLNLVFTRVLAPNTGFIAQRSAQVGDIVVRGQTLMNIVPLNQIWVEANYKETQIKRIRIGQPVTFTADMHGRSVKYHGKVLGFKSGSGIAFALLPPENASGNWIKIVQRVPVRISIDPEEVKNNPLFLAVSLRVRVDTSDTSGPMLAPTPTETPLYSTDIYNQQFIEVEEIRPIIEQIISENSKVAEDKILLPHLRDS